MSWTNYVFFWRKRNEETYWPKLLFRSYICIHTFIHSYMYVQNKLFFFALGKSPNYDIARDLNLIPEVEHLATASSSSLLQNYITQLKNWRDAKSWVGLWPGWGWSGIIITVRQQHTRKLFCVTRESKEGHLNQTIVIHPWIGVSFHPGWILIAIAKICWKSEIFQLKIQSIAWS